MIAGEEEKRRREEKKELDNINELHKKHFNTLHKELRRGEERIIFD